MLEIRESLRGQDLSFTEIAKIVGEKWQVLPADEREHCERQANSAKEKYYAELATYKKTPQFESYQKYLEDFKTKHAIPTKGQSPLLTSHMNMKNDRFRRKTIEIRDRDQHIHSKQQSRPPRAYCA